MPNQHTGGPGPIALQNREAILQSLASGKRLTDIAPLYGVIPNAISKVLKDDPEYRHALETSFDVRLDKAEDAILEAREHVDVSRARAYHDAIKWRAGVESDKHKQKQQLEVTGTINVDQVLKFDAAKLLENIKAVQHEPALIEHVDYVNSEDAK